MIDPKISGSTANRRENALPFIAYQIGGLGVDLVPADADRRWMDETTNHFANRCLPLRMANQMGWFVLNAEPVEAIWSGGPEPEAIDVRHFGKHPVLAPRSHFGSGILTWSIPYLFRTPPGYNVLVRGPANWAKDGAVPLDGVVETDWTVATFTMNWKLTRPGLTVSFDAGEPICVLIPLRRHELESFSPEIRRLSDDPELEAKHREWSRNRAKFIKQLPVDQITGHNSWQKHYFMGTSVAGERFPDHQKKLNLQPFAVTMRDKIEPSPRCEALPVDSIDRIPEDHSLPLRSHIVIENFWTRGEEMLDIYTRLMHGEDRRVRQIWEYCCDNTHSVYLQADPQKVFEAPLLQDFVTALRRWALETVGFSMVSNPFLRLYAGGCGESLHRQPMNPHLRYTYSLTRDGEKYFSGGETILKAGGGSSDQDLEQVTSTSQYHLAQPRFNELVLFDPQFMHGVRTIQAKASPLEGRVELCGHVAARLEIEGPLPKSAVKNQIKAALTAIVDDLKPEIDDAHGLATFRLNVDRKGRVTDSSMLFSNIVSANSASPLSADIISCIASRLTFSRFPEADGLTRITLPLFVRSSDSRSRS